MVTTAQTKVSKDIEQIPASKVVRDVKKQKQQTKEVSPGSSPVVAEKKVDELKALRIRNKALTEALQAIKDAASEETKKNFDLVWFAKNRYRYPNHEASKRIDGEYQEDIEKLKSDDGDFHHGYHTGLLAAARMFKEKADILHINNFEELSTELIEEAAKHTKKLKDAREQFPDTDVHNQEFPKV